MCRDSQNLKLHVQDRLFSTISSNAVIGVRRNSSQWVT